MDSALVEGLGGVFETMHLTRAAGRVFGYLLTVAPEERTAEAAAEQLGLSRGSVSAALTLLRSSMLIERVVEPGDRRHYYAARRGMWTTLMRQQALLISQIRQLADQAYAEAVAENRGDLDGLADMRNYYVRLDDSVTEFIDELEK